MTAWTLALTLYALGLGFVPLFDVLGYEQCLALALPATLAAAHLSAARVWRSRHRRTPADALSADAHPLRLVAMLFTRSFGLILAILAIPLLVSLLNALRVRNCDIGGGLRWFVMLPVLSAFAGCALGTCIGLARDWHRRVTPTLFVVAAIVGSILVGVWRFYAAPPIFGYDPFVGYFAGTIYDEDIRIGRAFLWARAYHVSAGLGFVLACAAFLDGASLSLRLRALRKRLLLPALICIFASGVIFHHRARHGFELDAGDVARALGAEKRTAHFVLHYSPRGPYAKDIDAFASDDEFRWQQLARFFGHAPEAPVHAYLFDSADDKRRLMGAAQTFIAKPWRREIYLQSEGWPQPVTMHELAHVFAGQYGDRLFGIARVGLHFNVGLIEGVAVAASWSGTPLTPHQSVKLLLDDGVLKPDALAQVMSPRFFGLNAGQAYSVAGSFVRFLVDEYGVAKLEQLFHAAGSDASYVAIYGKSFTTLRDEWLAMLSRVVVPVDEGALTLAHLKRPSVFHRACAHAVAARRQAARATGNNGDRAEALRQFLALCRDEPGDTVALADALEAALTAEDHAAAQRLAQEILQSKDPVLAGRAEMTLGDLRLLDGDAAAARQHYARAMALPNEESTARLIVVKNEIAGWPASAARDELVKFLATPPAQHDNAVDLMVLRGLVDAEPARALPHYLLARQLSAKQRWADVVTELTHPTTDKLPDGRFVREAQRVLATALFRLGRHDDARAIFDALARDRDAGEGARLDAADWRERCDFAKTTAATPTATESPTGR